MHDMISCQTKKTNLTDKEDGPVFDLLCKTSKAQPDRAFAAPHTSSSARNPGV